MVYHTCKTCLVKVEGIHKKIHTYNNKMKRKGKKIMPKIIKESHQ